MSWKAWGDDDDGINYDHLLDAGWLGPDEAQELRTEIERLNALINTPETEDFIRAIPLEAAHQMERWGVDHDSAKAPWDWYWTLSHLASKAVHSAINNDQTKAKHHIITSAALLLNWHRRLIDP